MINRFKYLLQFCLILGVLISSTDCNWIPTNEKNDNNGLILLILSSLNRKNDGCNLKTNFSICVPPGIAGN